MTADNRHRAHLTAFLTGVGYHESAWKLADPADLAGPARFGVLERAALTAERGLLDAVFLADSPGLAVFRARYFPQVGFDPLELLAALSRSTSRIGLIATASTTYSAPYDLARRLSTIDHLSGGRAGWNIVTTRYAGAAGNFGLAAHPDPADRYARAEEFVDVVTRLWESWDADAVLADQDKGTPEQIAESIRAFPAFRYTTELQFSVAYGTNSHGQRRAATEAVAGEIAPALGWRPAGSARAAAERTARA